MLKWKPLYRGFTGHVHLKEFALINMNGRMYDPIQGRILSPDNNVPDPRNTQGYNRYSYANNNPLIYVDPYGDNPLLIAAAIGALIGGVGYTAQVAFSDGGFRNWNWGQFGKSLASGAISGGISYGIGSAFGPVGSLNNKFARAFAHGYTSGIISGALGGDFKSAFWAGGFGSFAGSATSAYITNEWLEIGASALSGGIGSEIGGGNFWEGAATAAIITVLNHIGHPQRPDKDGIITLEEANYWYRKGGHNKLRSIYYHSEKWKKVEGKRLCSVWSQ